MQPSSLPDGIKTINVIGGANGWGATIVQAANDIGLEATITEKDTSEAEAKALAKEADVIFFAPTDTVIVERIQQIREELTGKCILDCATNKDAFVSLLQELSTSKSICSTHPMVKSDSPTEEQNVLLMNVGEDAQKARAVAEALYERLGMKPHDVQFEKHGDLMTILQFVPHTVQRLMVGAAGGAIESNGWSINDMSNLRTKAAKLAELAFGRVAILPAPVSAGIIANGMQREIGTDLFDDIHNQFCSVLTAKSPEALEESLSKGVLAIDPDQRWSTGSSLEQTELVEPVNELERYIQFLSHVFGHVMIRSLLKPLNELELSMYDLAELAPANFGFTQSNFRHIAQQASRSSHLIYNITKDKSRQRYAVGLVTQLLLMFRFLKEANESSQNEAISIMSDKFGMWTQRLDPKGDWLESIKVRTDAILRGEGKF